MIVAKIIVFYVILELLIRHYFYFEKKLMNIIKTLIYEIFLDFFMKKGIKNTFFFVTFYIFYESNIKTSLNIK